MGKITQIKVNCDLIYEAGQNAGGGTGGADMIVNFTYDDSTFKYTADKTAEEIISAVNAGQIVMGRIANGSVQLNYTPDINIMFQLATYSGDSNDNYKITFMHYKELAMEERFYSTDEAPTPYFIQTIGFMKYSSSAWDFTVGSMEVKMPY